MLHDITYQKTLLLMVKGVNLSGLGVYERLRNIFSKFMISLSVLTLLALRLIQT
jgi:hypothetical protein